MPSYLTIAVLGLSILIFVFSSETAYRLDRQRRFNYANPTYIMMVLTAISSALTSAICLLHIHFSAKKELKENAKKR